jgi:diketogulonate reductase-like aldo/keto reductase
MAHGLDCRAIRWQVCAGLHVGVVTSVIIGANRPDQLADNLAATQVALSSEELEMLDKVSALPAEYPGWMIGLQVAPCLAMRDEAPRTALPST